MSELLGADGMRLEIERPDGARRRICVRSRRLDSPEGRGERLRFVLLRDQARSPERAEERRLVALGRLAAGVGHDVNNLLTPVLGFAELTREAAGDRARVERYAAEIERSAGAATELIDRLLQLARTTSTAPVEVAGDVAVEATLPLLRTLTGSTVRLAVELEAGAARVRLRPGDLEQVLLNLVGNAREAMTRGGAIRLRTRTDDAGCWELRVDDDGGGIAPDELARIFDPGFTSKTGGRASGLGLWIVRGILDEAGGEIEIESRPGAGARVTVRLPAQPAPGGGV
jgi:signal transduction histidine kinase